MVKLEGTPFNIDIIHVCAPLNTSVKTSMTNDELSHTMKHIRYVEVAMVVGGWNAKRLDSIINIQLRENNFYGLGLR